MAEYLLQGETASRVEKIVREHVGVSEELSPQMHLQDDLGIDSLERVEIVVKLEKIFDLDLANDLVRGSATLGDLIQVVIDAQQARVVRGIS